VIWTEIDSRPATVRERFYFIGLIWRVLNDARREGQHIPLTIWFLPIRQYIFRVQPMASYYLINRGNNA